MFKYSLRAFAPKGLCDPSKYNLLFLQIFLNFPDLISCSLAILFILVIPSLIFSSFTPSCKFLTVAIAVAQLSI